MCCAIRATGGNRPQDYYMYKAGRYIRKDQPTIEEENTFFFLFSTCLFTTLKRIRGAGGICQTDSQSSFYKVMRWVVFMKQNLRFGLVWVVVAVFKS